MSNCTPSRVMAGLLVALACGGASAGDDEQPPASRAAAAGRPSAVELAARRDRIRAYFQARQKSLAVVRTTLTRSGQVIDWVPRPPNLATPPPMREGMAQSARRWAKTELELQPEARGPRNTVPYVRFDVEGYLKWIGDRVPASPELVFETLRKPRPEASGYYYVLWRLQANPAAGSSPYRATAGVLNLWDVAQVASGETSIMEAGVARGSGVGADFQSIEAGKIESTFNGGAPTFFVYYTTNNYTADGDWQGGWNGLVAGWQQFSPTVAPGTAWPAGSLSQPGGQQAELGLHIELFEGNWWVAAGGTWVGYYPQCKFLSCNNGFLFSDAGLRQQADLVSWYGEIGRPASTSATSSDMGSGQPADQGFARAAFIRDLQVITTFSPNTWQWFHETAGTNSTRVTDRRCYSIAGPTTNSSTDVWRNYFFLGGGGKEQSGCR